MSFSVYRGVIDAGYVRQVGNSHFNPQKPGGMSLRSVDYNYIGLLTTY